MRKIVLTFLLVSCFGSIDGLAQRPTNVIALENGSKLIKIPPSQVDITERMILAKYSAGALFDQNARVWSSKRAQFPLEFVVELAEEYHIQKFVFNNKTEFYPGIQTKDVKVELSTTSASEGFTEAGKYELEPDVTNEFTISPTKARWIKLVILSNHGSDDKVQLAEFEALGSPAQRINRTVTIDGMWHTNWQDITFEQEGNTFEGSYVYTSGKRKFKGKVKNGKINRNTIQFYWDEGSIEGMAKLFLNQEGKQLSGLWRNANNSRDYNLWTMTRTKEESKPIEYSGPQEVVAIEEKEDEKEAPPAPPVVPAVPVKPAVEIGGTEVSVGKSIVLKNVFFELGKSSVTAASHAELDKLVDYLLNNEEMNVKINGHTDRIGDRKKNLILSQERADSIMEYLIGKGINKKRITTEGKGDTETICSPPCRDNRRVDFVLSE
ncbi:MAG: OmpA family protein [Cyclobacteriaceae bacterium]